MKALVTGGAGFMGSHVADVLIAKGVEVYVLDDLSGGFRDNVSSEADFIRGSVCDARLVNDLFSKCHFDYVFHLAAYAAEGLSHFIRNFNYNNNLIGSVNLINASVKHDIKCFIFTSSIAVYGRNQLPMTEDMVPHPEDPYGISKYAVELDLRSAHDMFGLNYIIFRPHNVYGERQNIGDKYRNVIGIFMNQIMQRQPMTIFGDGTQTRAFSYIGDVAPMIVESMSRTDCYNDTFNIGSDKPCSVKELAEMVAEIFDTTPDIRFVPERNEVKHAYSSNEKVRKLLGFSSQTDLRNGLEKMAEWAKVQGPRKCAAFSNIEITRNLPSSWLEK